MTWGGSVFCGGRRDYTGAECGEVSDVAGKRVPGIAQGANYELAEAGGELRAGKEEAVQDKGPKPRLLVSFAAAFVVAILVLWAAQESNLWMRIISAAFIASGATIGIAWMGRRKA